MICNFPHLCHSSFTEQGLQSIPLAGFPSLSWTISDSVSGSFAEGSSTGASFMALSAAVGEHRERLHFYELGSSPAHKIDYLYHLGNDALIQFGQVLMQNPVQAVFDQTIFKHRFRLQPVWNLLDNSKAYFPEVYLSLNPDHVDRAYLPLSDSTACASHVTAAQSIRASFYEFCERQSLLYHWFAGTIRGEFNWESRMAQLPYPRLWSLFAEMGELRVFDISLFEGIPVVLCLYRSFPPQPVQYLVATAASASLSVALQSAMEELWQGYCFMLNYMSHPERVQSQGDRYIRHFVQCNHPQTVETFAAWNQQRHALLDLDFSEDPKDHSFTQNIEKLRPWTDNLFAYSFQQLRGSSAVYYSKVFSTDFFPFMAVDKLPADIPVLSRHHIYRHRFSHIAPLPFP